MSDPRDTHFTGFARLVIKDLHEVHALRMDIVLDELEMLISRRAYDLVENTIEYMQSYIRDGKVIGQELPVHVPDLKESE